MLLSELLTIGARVQVAQEAAGGDGQKLHWDGYTGKQRAAEVMGRMKGPSALLEQLLSSSEEAA